MIGYCLFCNREEGHGYRPGKDIEFVCSRCIQVFLSAGQIDLKKAHKKAIDKGYINKAKAIKSFLIDEGENGKRPTKRNRKNFNRKRITRVLRNQAKRIGRFTA